MIVYTQFNASVENAWNHALQYEPVKWPFYTYLWHKNWHNCHPSGTPIIFYHEQQNIVCSLHKTNNDVHFGGGEELADYLDAIGDNTHKAAVWEEIRAHLTNDGVQKIVLRNIPESSGTLEYFRHVKHTTVSNEDTTPWLALPKTVHDYFSALNRKQRHEIQRKKRKFESIYPHTRLIVTRGQKVDMPSVMNLMRLDAKKAIFLSPPVQEFFHLLPKTCGDSLCTFELRQHNDTLAIVLAFCIDNSILLYNSGFDPSVSGSGLYLKMRIIEWAIEQNITLINFLQGNERYKYDLGATDSWVFRVQAELAILQ